MDFFKVLLRRKRLCPRLFSTLKSQQLCYTYRESQKFKFVLQSKSETYRSDTSPYIYHGSPLIFVISSLHSSILIRSLNLIDEPVCSLSFHCTAFLQHDCERTVPLIFHRLTMTGLVADVVYGVDSSMGHGDGWKLAFVLLSAWRFSRTHPFTGKNLTQPSQNHPLPCFFKYSSYRCSLSQRTVHLYFKDPIQSSLFLLKISRHFLRIPCCFLFTA